MTTTPDPMDLIKPAQEATQEATQEVVRYIEATQARSLNEYNASIDMINTACKRMFSWQASFKSPFALTDTDKE